MSWLFFNKLNISSSNSYHGVNLFLFLVIVLSSSCGRIYFPIELNTISRAERLEKQQTTKVKVIPMSSDSVRVANTTPYKRFIVEVDDLKKPAKQIPAELALVEKFPSLNDPGPYLIGVGDILGYEELISVLGTPGSSATLITRLLTVNEDGLINFFQLGRIRAENRTLSELEDEIYSKVVQAGGNTNFNLYIKEFLSKEILVSANGVNSVSVPFVSNPIYIDEILEKIRIPQGLDAKISIFRGEDEYVFSYKKLTMRTKERVRLFPGDRVFVKTLNYKTEKVLLVGETGAQSAIPINSTQRPTLSDAIFSGGVLSNITSDFSQIYVLREKKKLFHAYHLDITDPTRIGLASRFEMRPDDIVFVATQPLSLYSRALSQILGSTGLTLEARDTLRTEIGN